MTLSFEEFHTAQKRERASQSVATNNKNRPPANEASTRDADNANDKLPTTATKSSWSQRTIGKTLETCEVQFAVSALIYLDLIASTLLLFINNHRTETYGSSTAQTIYHEHSLPTCVLTSFQNFTLICFVLELTALLYAFRLSTLSHLGYVTDILIVLTIVYDGAYGPAGIPLRLLGLLRVWRIARLVATAVDGVRALHDVTRLEGGRAEGRVGELGAEVERLEEEGRLEREGRVEVERMLRGFKDEADTLKEALQIAAVEVAGVAEEELGEDGCVGREVECVEDGGERYYDGSGEETRSVR